MPDEAEFRPIVDEKPRDIHSEIDTEIFKIRDKVRLVDEAKKHPPKPGVMKTEIPDGVYAIDLNALLAAQLSDCPATIIPMLIDHGVRTAVDIKETYKPEKRIMDFNYWWVIAVIIGSPVVLLIANMFFKIF